MSIWLGVDLGNARVGLALSDPELSMAYPIGNIKVLHDYFAALDQILETIRDHHVEHVVIGYPLNMDGSAGKAAKKAQRWAHQLEVRFQQFIAYGYNLEMWGVSNLPEDLVISLQDERLTTVSAHRQLRTAGYLEEKHRPMVDQQSAVLILQTALEKHQRHINA